MRKLLLFFFLLLLHSTAWCWNYSYHFVIAQIAFDQLTTTEKNKLITLLSQNSHFSQHHNYLYASIYPDLIKKQQFKQWDSWHYINLPYSIDGTKTKPVNYPNVVSQLKKLNKEYKQTTINEEKALFLSLIIHLTGDIHQPMHCIDLYSVRFPEGDRGGNLYLLPMKKTSNLHRLWDDGLELRQTFFGDSNSSFNRIKQLAAYLENKYPKSLLQQPLKQRAPDVWANESYNIARNVAYQTPFNVYPSKEYLKQGRNIVERQLALAGYRLAIELREALNQN